MVSFTDAPSLGAYGDDPEWIAAADAARDLLERAKGRDLSRDELRLIRRYNAKMDAASDRAREAHKAFLRDNGLLTHE